MPLEDMIGSTPDFSADSVLDRVSRGVLPDLPANANQDMILNRLNRKLSIPRKMGEDEADDEDEKKPDFSSQGVAVDKLPDFSSQGIPVSGPTPAAPAPTQVSLGTTGQAKAAAKGLAGAVPEAIGGAVKGAGEVLARGQGTLAPEGNQFAAQPMPTDAGGRITTPEKAMAVSPIIPAGQSIQDLAPHMTPEEQASIGGRIGSGVGQVGMYAATTLLAGPLAGLSFAATIAGLDSYNSMYEAARKAGKSDDDANNIAMKAGAISAALSSVPLDAGRWVNGLAKRVLLSGGAFATAGEAQEAILQQLAKEYDPKAGYSPEAERIITNLVMGGAVGGLHHAMAPDVQPPQQPGAGPQPTAGAIPPGGPQPQPGAGPGPQPGAGPRPGTPPPGAGPGPDTSGYGGKAKPGEQPKTAEQASAESGGPIPPRPGTGKGPDFEFNNPTKRKSMEGVVQTMSDRNGWGLDATKMTDAELWNAVVSNEQNSTAAKSSQAKPETPEEAAQREATAKDREITDELIKSGVPEANVKYMTPEQRKAKYAEVTETQAKAAEKAKADVAEQLKTKRAHVQETLRKAGFSDDEIKAMPAEERKQRYQDATRTTTAEAERPPEMKVEEPPSSGEVAAGEAEAKPSGKREEPITPQTADDVVAAKPAEPKSTAQAEAENYQHAHVDLPQFGLTGKRNISIETGVGQDRKGVDEEGQPWSVTMTHGAYGRLKGTEGADGMPLDAFIGPHPTSPYAFVIDQHDPKTGEFDEHKIMLGYRTPIDALHAYAHSYNDQGKDRIGHVTAMKPDEFQAWLKTDTTQPLRPKKEPVSTPHKGEETGLGGAPPSRGTSAEEAQAAPTTEPGVTQEKPARKPHVRLMNDERHLEPTNLMQFIVQHGGLKVKGVKYGPELIAMDAHKHIVSMPKGHKGFPGLVNNKRGLAPDDMATLAQQHFYWPKDQKITGNDLVEAVREGIAKKHRVPETEEALKPKKERVAEDERDRHEREMDEAHYGDARREIDDNYPGTLPDLRDKAACSDGGSGYECRRRDGTRRGAVGERRGSEGYSRSRQGRGQLR